NQLGCQRKQIALTRRQTCDCGSGICRSTANSWIFLSKYRNRSQDEDDQCSQTKGGSRLGIRAQRRFELLQHRCYLLVQEEDLVYFSPPRSPGRFKWAASRD